MKNMSIKEAGRYANFLEDTRRKLIYLAYSGIDSKLVNVVESHKKSDAFKEAEDTVIKVEFEDVIDVELETLTELIEDIIKEKVLLASSIAKAKGNIEIEANDGQVLDLDSSIEYAKILRDTSSDFFARLISKKESKTKSNAKAYAFNVEGNQTPYYYEVETEKTLNYVKSDYVKRNNMHKALADKLSTGIDKAMSNDIVEFEPKYNYLDSYEDIINDAILN